MAVPVAIIKGLETAGKALETAEKVKVASEVKAGSEIGASAINKTVFNPDKRIDSLARMDTKKTKDGFNPDRRIEKKSPEIKKEVSPGDKTFDSLDKPKEIKPKDANPQVTEVEKLPRPIEMGIELPQNIINDLLDKGMSPGIVNDVKRVDDVLKLKTVNKELVNTVHPGSGVAYNNKVIDFFGYKIEGVFPRFDAAFTTKLPSDKLLAKDKVQFDHCNSELREAIRDNPELKNKFSDRQLQQIADGKTPSGYTWNHNEEIGKMELVDSVKHDMAKHTGGKAIWGGGKAYR